uniref:Uncharacterized protein n=1 Tax=viral metagenome TaxID=1070528 RepID=A0A6C0HMK4_9ZZZZ
MNSQQNKAYLWKQCIEQGIFNTLNSSVLPTVQKRFEELVKEYENSQDAVELKNEQFLREFRSRLMPSFEDTQKEYDKLLQPPKPPMVDFTREPDKPMQDLTSLLEKTNERRKEEIQQVFSDKPFLTQEKDPILERMERTLQKHSEMLLSILETQMKLIDYLQRNKK